MLKKKCWLFFSLFILGVFLCTSCLPKPPVTEGILKGQVIVPEGTVKAKDLTGQALPNATVNIIDPLTGAIIATTTTDANGYYQVFVPAGGPYLLEAIKDGVKLQQFTPQVEVGIEYNLGTADCGTTAVALIAQAMLEDDSYPDNPADINLADIEADPDFNEVMSIVCSIIEAGGDPTVSALVQQVVKDFLHPPAPTPTPTPTPLSDAKAITAFSFAALDPGVVGVINEAAKTIALTVPFGTDVTALVPTIVHTGASVSPASGVAHDFTSPVNYTVTAENTSTQVYLVTVTVAAPVIATVSTIDNGAVAPTVTVTGTNFKATIAASDLTVDKGTTDLTFSGVIWENVTHITVAFTGKAAAGDVTIQAKTSAFDPAGVSASNTLTITIPLVVGDSYGGGIVAYILQPGEKMYDTGDVVLYNYSATKQHGLIAATADQSTGIFWHVTNDGITGASGLVLGTGNANTNAIVALYGAESNAARLCYDLSLNGYSDWYLPSKDELDKLHLNKDKIGSFASANYWSSSEFNASYAWKQLFPEGDKFYYDKDNIPRVRAVRAF